MELAEFVDRLDEELRTDAYADLDASANGLQVGPDSAEVEHVAVAVDGVQETFERAADAGADALLTHHGISWGGFDRVTGRTYDQVETLLENDLALYVSHLPLDGHQELGNAAGVADVLDLEDRAPFGELGPEYIGQRGVAPESYTTAQVRERLETSLEGRETPVQVLEGGPDELEEIAIITGSGTDWLAEAEAAGADALVTGEGKQKAYHEARERGLTVFLAGHYATETFGVRAIQERLEEWDLETTYIDIPTGL
ncbi:Nif3-like dinuclear metal center hexameric protein [Natronorubrum daqingense]|uniref:Dinuclear metal center protein, YbgI/SA1388 family n=1 Tax=Natronorubrum daqingense TaxID=588898 RepID=A0A1N6ZB35_9EURY|nr:Nif3-like dinuclear metal center hexameric protein [Natronorubrum daqingense]APX95404.1 Nif3-like dinuclear metal center hexameric protein [Natronorubrum daqingense]SIR24001.1 dinuclear metal center protein, YbgI/SA1388 family [Natronorubrum daqingense]